MENSHFNSMRSHHEPQSISIPCISLCFLMVVILGFLPVIPDRIVKMVKPAFIALCFVSAGLGYYRFGFEKWLIILHVYLFAIWLANIQFDPSFRSYASMLLFALFYLFAGVRIWNREEIKLIFKSVVFSCAIYSVIVLYSNNGLLHASGNQHISFLSLTVNRNSSAFAVVPGTVAALLMFFYDKKNIGLRIVYAFVFLGCFYTMVALACRSAFLSATTGSFFIVWQAIRENTDTGHKFFRQTVFILLIVALLLIGMNVLEGTISSRLFDYSSTGRDDLWDAAWELIRQKPIFGGGFSYWSRSGQLMSPHNTFLNIMMISGYIGGGILGLMMLFMLHECLKAQNLAALAFAMETLFHSISEAGLDYYAYIPLVLATILLRYSEYQSKKLTHVFI